MKVPSASLVMFSIFVGLAIPSLPASAQRYPKLSRTDLKTLQSSFADVADEVLPSVVAIRTYQGMRLYSQGSGVIIRSDGYIVTNYHVIEESPIVKVTLHNGIEYIAAVMQVDQRSDLAVLKIHESNLRAAKLGNLEDVHVGHWTFAVGNPFGVSNFSGNPSFTIGNVSSIGRNLTQQLDQSSTRYYGNLIETSATINPGNSGGPLFNIDGDVIGIVAAIETSSGVSEGVGFAIPISKRTRAIINSLIDGDQVRYGFLGVTIGPAENGVLHRVGRKKVHGALVASIIEDGPAYQADLRSQDVIIQLDGQPIEDSDHLIRLIGGILPGDSVNVRYVRGGRVRHTTAVLDERDIGGDVNARHSESFAPTFNWRGADFAEMANKLGLEIKDVRRGSDADHRGLQPRQVITAVNGQRVHTLEQFFKARNVAGDAISLTTLDDETIRFPRG
jgi:serine protease Do